MDHYEMKIADLQEEIERIEGEIWLGVENYNGSYQVSTAGRVRSLDGMTKSRKNGKVFDRKRVGQIIKPKSIKNGYQTVRFHKNGTRKTELIHRVVAKAFIKNPNKKPCVNHIDSNIINNNVNNLEWCTYAENSAHASSFGNLVKGEMSHFSKLNNDKVLLIRDMLAYSREAFSLSWIANLFKVTPATIILVRDRKTWEHVKEPNEES